MSRLLLFLAVYAAAPELLARQQEVDWTPPVLAFPESGIDDPEAYAGYFTRFVHDAHRNTVQIIVDTVESRVVHLWANGANESMSFTARQPNGQPVAFDWASPGVISQAAGLRRIVRHKLKTSSRELELGHVLLCSMRKEREFQYHRKHLLPFDAPPFHEPELLETLNLLQRCPVGIRKRFLDLLGVQNIHDLRERLDPKIETDSTETSRVIRFIQPTFDGKNLLTMEFSVDRRAGSVARTPNGAIIRSFDAGPLEITISIGTDSPSLTPFERTQLFTPEFLNFYGEALQKGNSSQARWLDRQIRSLELLSSQEKLMAGLPNFATYFGRDMIMSMLMLEPVLHPAMQQHAIKAILKKLSPEGQVSHEESLGGQAIRENAALANTFLRRALQSSSPESTKALLDRAAEIVASLQRTREDYKMLDDDFQFPVLVARYFKRNDVSPKTKRAFLQERIGDKSVLDLLLRNLSYVANQSAAYVSNPLSRNLIAFPPRAKGRWLSASWRDSNAGYANGRYAMDINVVWVPEALNAARGILRWFALHGITPDSLEKASPEFRASKLSAYVRNSSLLDDAIARWHGAARHFIVTIPDSEIRQRIISSLGSFPSNERKYWNEILGKAKVPPSFRFLALSLDSSGKALPIPNTDGGMLLFVKSLVGSDLLDTVLDPILAPYPMGLFIENLGPVVANDLYATEEIREEFRNDRYHSPYVVWGREVNLLLLGLWNQRAAAIEPPVRNRLQDAWDRISRAAEASGLRHNELWTYRIRGNHLAPLRYVTGSDIQAWNVTDLAMQFLLWKNRQ